MHQGWPHFSLLEGNADSLQELRPPHVFSVKGDIFLMEQLQKHLPEQNVAVTTRADFLGFREPLPALEKIWHKLISGAQAGGSS